MKLGLVTLSVTTGVLVEALMKEIELVQGEESVSDSCTENFAVMLQACTDLINISAAVFAEGVNS